MKILIVEDTLERIQAFKELLNGELVFTDSANAAIDLLSRDCFDVLFLDYDLGEGKDSGGKVARWIEEHPQESLRIIIHSMNPVGAKRVQDILPTAERIPFPNLVKKTGTAYTSSNVKIISMS